MIRRSTPAHVFWLALAALALLLAGARGALADGTTMAGSWNMTAVTETFTVQQWSGPCGPAPQSGISVPGGPVTIRADQSELVVVGPRKTLRTDQCIDPMPTLSPETHSSDGRTWRTRCATPPGDARHAVINTAYFVGSDNVISVAETGRYEFTIQGSRCVADVTREASLTRAVAGAPRPEVASAPTPVATAGARSLPAASAWPSAGPPAPAAPGPAREGHETGRGEPDCSLPGDPARLEVRPSRKLLRVGETYRFHALVVDASGCPTGTAIQWSIGGVRTADGNAAFSPTIDGNGKLDVPAAAIGEAKLDVVAMAAGHSAHASVEVTSASGYEQLLAQSGLDSNGERSEPAVTLLASSALGATDALGQDGARRRRTIFLVIVGALAAALGAVGVYAAQRARKARALERAAQQRHAERLAQHERTVAERQRQHAAQMRAHLESVAAVRADVESDGAIGAAPLVCPTCRREFADGSVFCPFDSSRLAPASAPPLGTVGTGTVGTGTVAAVVGGAALGGTTALAPVPTRGKICPTCGGRFEGNAAYCGKDGTQLVLLN